MIDDRYWLAAPDLIPSPMADPEFVAKLPSNCVGKFRCLAEYVVWQASQSPFETPQPANDGDRVYFIGGEDGPVKIGLTNNPESRLMQLQTGSPVRLKILAVVRGGRWLERAYHKMFEGSRVHGEWFERSKLLADEIGYWSRRRPGTRKIAQIYSEGMNNG